VVDMVEQFNPQRFAERNLHPVEIDDPGEVFG
jgi:hypothetical protein